MSQTTSLEYTDVGCYEGWNVDNTEGTFMSSYLVTTQDECIAAALAEHAVFAVLHLSSDGSATICRTFDVVSLDVTST